MVCIYCQTPTGVTNSRAQKRLNQVWRRRKCPSCGSVFTTLESPDLLTSLSVEHKSFYEPFSRYKLFLSIHDSLMHRKSAISDAEALTDTLISKLYPHIVAGTINRRHIINTAILVLKRFDKVAATYYEAYHPLN